MITVQEYFGGKPHGAEHLAAAEDLLARVNALVSEAEAAGSCSPTVCPNTGTEISGSKGGSGDGGFRLPGSKTGAATSSHKEARAVDVYDPQGKLDGWLDRFEGEGGANSKLEEHGLYREAPIATPGWCHLSTRAPRSGRRTFFP